MASQEESTVATTEEVQTIDSGDYKHKTTKSNRGKVADVLPPRVFLAIDEQETDDESVRSPTVFHELCRVFLGIMKNGESQNIKTKKIALYQRLQ